MKGLKLALLFVLVFSAAYAYAEGPDPFETKANLVAFEKGKIHEDPDDELWKMLAHAEWLNEVVGADTFVMYPDTPVIATGNLDPPSKNDQLNSKSNRFSLAWAGNSTQGTFDSNEECAEATNEACINAGHTGSDASTAEVTYDDTGCRICSADCEGDSGAVAIIFENCD
jgi:hypothetical protein